jgi:type VI secretion system protein ImpK
MVVEIKPMPEARQQNLASCYENAFTMILRLVSIQRQPSANSQDFRTSIRAALKAAMEQAKSLGYSSEANQMAFFAVVALLDESVLKLQNPAFADWAQRPLQEEMFGHNRAGEVFFDHLRTLLTRADSPETADCLEVYCLCMLLGFKGKYALSSSISFLSGGSPGAGLGASRTGAEIKTLIAQCRAKIDRIRGQASFLPAVAIPPVRHAAPTDRWSRGLGIAAAALFVILVLVFTGAWFVLSSGASHLG